MHLQGTVAAAQGDAPFAVAQQLDLIVAGLLDIELDEDVLVVPDPVGLDLVEDLPNHARRFCGRLFDQLVIGILGGQERCTENPLTLAAAAADRLEAEPAPGILFEQLGNFGLDLRAELLDGEEIDPLRVGSEQDMVCQGLQGHLRVFKDLCVAGEVLGLDQRQQLVPGRVLFEQRTGGHVVDAGGDADVDVQGGPLGLVFLPGTGLGRRAGADELEPGLFDGGNEFLVLGHEAVAGKDRIVAVVLGDLDDLVDALDTLFLAGAGVIGDAVDAPGIGQLAQFGSQGIGVDDGILLGEEYAEMGYPHLAIDIHRLFPDRAAADDERFQVLAGKGTHPRGGGLAQAAILVDQGVVHVVISHRSLSPKK